MKCNQNSSLFAYSGSSIDEFEFTLIEIMAVIAIIILVSAISYPYIAKTPARLVIHQAAVNIQNLMTTARLQASLRGVPRFVQFDNKSKKFYVRNNSDEQIAKSNETEDLHSFNETSDSQYSLPHDLEVSFSNPNQGNPNVVFFPDGTTSGAKIKMSFKGHELFISVSRLTGIAKVISVNEERNEK